MKRSARSAWLALALCVALSSVSANAVPVVLAEARLRVDVPATWQRRVINGRLAQFQLGALATVDVAAPPIPRGGTIDTLLASLRSDPDLGAAAWSSPQPVTINGMRGATQRASVISGGVPTTVIQTWVTVPGRAVVFTVRLPNASAATNEAGAQAIVDSLRSTRR